MVKIVNRPRTYWSSPQPFLRLRPGGRNVVTHQEPEPTKVLACPLRDLETTRTLQAAADASTISRKGHALFPDRVITGSR
jgi:hypothetical protein